jgi:deoxycytidylate deaminase
MAKRRKQFSVTATCYDKKGKVLSVGHNNYKKTHPLQAYFACKVGLNEKIFLHAEIDALIKSTSSDIHKILVERFDSKGNPANAEPCAVCKSAIAAYGVKYVEYTC